VDKKTRIIEFLVMCAGMAVIYGVIQTGDTVKDFLRIIVIAAVFAIVETTTNFIKAKRK